MKRPGAFLWLGAVTSYFFLYAPIAVVIVYSFNAARHGGAWAGFTTEWYTTLVRSPEKLAAVRNSWVLAAVSTAIATVLGSMLGYGLSRYAFAGKRLFSWLMYVPVLVPDIVAAVAMLMFYSFLRDRFGGMQLGLATMIVAHVTFQIPLVAIVVRSRLTGIDPAIEEAANDLGATAWQRMIHVTLPLMAPGIGAGAALAFTSSIDDFVVSFFTSGPGSTTLPILIYSSVKRGITPEINALSTLILLASVAGSVALCLLRGHARIGSR